MKEIWKADVCGMIMAQVGSVGEEYNSSDWANTTYCAPAGRKSYFPTYGW